MSYKSKKGEIISQHSYSRLSFEQKAGYTASQEKPTHKANEKGEITEIKEGAETEASNNAKEEKKEESGEE